MALRCGDVGRLHFYGANSDGAVAIIFWWHFDHQHLDDEHPERTREIGTMRAIGAQRGLSGDDFHGNRPAGIIFRSMGVVAGSGTVWILEAVGIAPWNDVTRFFFMAVLRPALHSEHIVWALVSIVFVSVAATIYPVYLATRITCWSRCRRRTSHENLVFDRCPQPAPEREKNRASHEPSQA